MQILACKHLMTAPMAQLPLVRLRPIAIEDFANSLRDPAPGQKVLSGSTIRSICPTLRRALDVAVREGIIETNPTKDIALPRADKRTARALSTEDAQLLLAELRTSRYYPAFALIATTGMRRGEALGLKWSDIDLGTGTLTVRRTLSQATGGPATGAPKTSSSNRRIALPDGTRRILLEWAVEQQEDRARAGSRWQDDNWVFTNPTGGPGILATSYERCRTPSTVSGCRRARAFTPCATLLPPTLLEAGIHARAVADILGHASATTTLEIYGHTTAKVVREAGDHLADALLPVRDDTSAE
jgi:integrase